MNDSTTRETNLTILNEEDKFLSWIDYSLLLLMLLVSFVIGSYFGLSTNKARTTEEYLLGGKTVSFLPISLSIVATSISGTTLLAVPADIYIFGSSYFWTIISDLVAFVLTLFIFLPIYFELQVVTIFEYLEARFDSNVRLLTSTLNIIASLCYSPIVLYIPSLAFSKVTGIQIHIIAIVVTVVCTLYTTVGGFKAVIWTDALQFTIMMGAIIAILAIGVQSVGGFWETILIAVRGERWDIFDFNLDLTSRRPLWGPLVGQLFYSLSCISVSQLVIQKYMGLKKMTDIKRCFYIHMVGFTGIKIISLLIGNAIYAKYAQCDAFRSGKVQKVDELVPYFVLDVAGNIPGLPGLFFAGIFSAALSTLSSSLNGIATTIHRDWVTRFISNNISQKKDTNIIKAIVVLVGVFSICALLLVERVGGIYPFSTTLQSIVGAPIVGIFTLGMLCPFANAKGVIIGAVSGVLITAWFVVGNTIYRIQGLLPFEGKPTSTEKCGQYSNNTEKFTQNHKDIFVLYRISFWYYAAISSLTVIAVGMIVSWFTKEENVVVNKNLFSPLVRSYLPKKSIGGVHYDVVKSGENLDNEKCNVKENN